MWMLHKEADFYDYNLSYELWLYICASHYHYNIMEM